MAIIKYPRTPTVLDGVTFTVNNDGSVTLNGTSTKNYVDFYLYGTWGNDASVELDADKDYTTRRMPQGVSFVYGVRGNTVETMQEDRHHKGIPIAFIFVRVNGTGTTFNNVTIYPQINEGTTLLDYEPYTGGKPSPSPEYPQEIKVVVNPIVKVVGKNLLNLTSRSVTNNGVTCMANGDGTYTLNGTATSETDFYIYGSYDNVIMVPLDI